MAQLGVLRAERQTAVGRNEPRRNRAREELGKVADESLAREQARLLEYLEENAQEQETRRARARCAGTEGEWEVSEFIVWSTTQQVYRQRFIFRGR